MNKFIYKYCVRSFYSGLYISGNYGQLLTENYRDAKLYDANTALKVAKNAERLFNVKFCIEMQCRECIIK